MPWNEDDLHRWLARRPVPRVLAGSPGHDAAVLRASGGRAVVCIDQTIEGVHFETGERPRRIAHKAVARTLSDLAASAARPVAVLLAVRAPRERTNAWLRELVLGAAQTAQRHGAELVGGDLAAAPGPLALTVSAHGRFDAGGRPPGRDRARAGDVVLASGPCGGSLVRGRHLRIVPRLELGRWLVERGARALMDVSDGVAIDCWRLARASRVAIELTALAAHRDAHAAARLDGRSAIWHALHDGEDHELLATMSPADWERARAAAGKRFAALGVIGRVRAGAGLSLAPELVRAAGCAARWSPREGGWLHGAN